MRIIVAGALPRLESQTKLTRADFDAIARTLEITPLRARRIGYVAAKRAERREVVETHWNGTETTNTAEPGDWIVTSLSPRQEPLRDRNGSLNTYVIPAERFPGLYQPAGLRNQHGAVYRAKGNAVLALPLRGGFNILAPWGNQQLVASGYLLLNGDEVTGISRDVFAITYKVQSD
jgi:hypothetical protein